MKALTSVACLRLKNRFDTISIDVDCVENVHSVNKTKHLSDLVKINSSPSCSLAKVKPDWWSACNFRIFLIRKL